MIGAGLKKWMPQTCAGRAVANARSITGSVDVLVARIADGLRRLVECAEQIDLHVELLDHGLDDQIAVDE
jgi:hypothetical protein